MFVTEILNVGEISVMRMAEKANARRKWRFTAGRRHYARYLIRKPNITESLSCSDFPVDR